MYDRNLTEASKGALLELCMALNEYKQDYVLIGGWAPYFLSVGDFDHCGSIDIDLVLRPKIMRRYESIKEIIQSLGYVETNNPFRFNRTLQTLDKINTFETHLDFLTEPEPVSEDILIKIQEDLRACLINGISVVFDFYYEQELNATLPNGGDATHKINVADIVGILTTKGNALLRLKDKDSYDIYSVAGFTGGSPEKAAETYSKLLNSKKPLNREFINSSMNNIEQAFSSPSRYGSFAVSRFIGTNGSIRTDAYQRVTTFLENISTIEPHQHLPT
jgi:hypothetical protein